MLGILLEFTLRQDTRTTLTVQFFFVLITILNIICWIYFNGFNQIVPVLNRLALHPIKGLTNPIRLKIFTQLRIEGVQKLAFLHTRF